MIETPCVAILCERDGILYHAQTDVRLLYNPADPYAVGLFFDDDCAWWFARELLHCRSSAPQGIGDVIVRPDGHMVLVRLRSPDGTLLLGLPRAAVDLFLDATYREVPEGQEEHHLDLDLGLRAVLDGPYGYPAGRKHDPDNCRQCRRRGGVR